MPAQPKQMYALFLCFLQLQTSLFFCSPVQLSCPAPVYSCNSVLFAKQVRDLKDTLGVCISAGGLRSVAFSLGALREFSKAGSHATKMLRSATPELNA